jgi:hypothetical protein
MTSIVDLNVWFLENRELMLQKGIRPSYTLARRSENGSARIDFETEKTLSRATLWTSGEFQIESIDAGTSQPILWEAYKVKNKKELANLLDGFLDGIV